jgi:nucleotide-binding universal stress UspA family protein
MAAMRCGKAKEMNLMPKYKTILVPVDLAYEDKAGPMIEQAGKLADKDTKLILLNVVDSLPSFVTAQLPDGAQERARLHAEKSLKKIAKTAGLKADVELRTGAAPAGILDVAKDRDAGLILVGSHKPGMQDYLLGSTAARVVRHARCSVLVLR